MPPDPGAFPPPPWATTSSGETTFTELRPLEYEYEVCSRPQGLGGLKVLLGKMAAEKWRLVMCIPGADTLVFERIRQT